MVYLNGEDRIKKEWWITFYILGIESLVNTEINTCVNALKDDSSYKLGAVVINKIHQPLWTETPHKTETEYR